MTENKLDNRTFDTDLCRGYCLLALNKACPDMNLALEIMDRLDAALYGGATPEEARAALKDFEFALSDWHC